MLPLSLSDPWLVPPPGGWKGHPLFSLENVYRAYRQCRRRKRNTWNAMQFESRLEDELVALHEELESGMYRPGAFLAFMVERPKRREIFAAQFRDRVVHHVLVSHLEPRWERRFIHDSFACRKGKGTHRGVERVQTFARRVTANGTRRAWYLQLDVRGFFMAIDRERLFGELAARERDPAVLWLAAAILDADPTRGCRFRGARREDFECLPAHRTLFRAKPGCGLPIGNLTSQFFANVYLDRLDQFVKHMLRARCYIRYCDDLVLLSADRAELQEWEGRIAEFLRTSLGLELNERRKLRPVSDGIDFLGYIVRPAYLLVRRRVVRACVARLAEAEASAGVGGDAWRGKRTLGRQGDDATSVRARIHSYGAHFRRASSYRLVQRMRQRFPRVGAFLSGSETNRR